MSTILIAYERELEQNALERVLTERGHTVVRSNNGVEALDMARREPPALAMSDILLPKMDGFALCKKWKQDERLQFVPFMFYTRRHEDPKYARFALEVGADRYIERSSDPLMLLKTVDEVLAQAAATPRIDTMRLRALNTGSFTATGAFRTGAYLNTGAFANTGTQINTAALMRTGAQSAAQSAPAVASAAANAGATADSALTSALAREQRLLARINEIDALNKQLQTSEERLRQALETTERTTAQIAESYQTLLIAAADGYWLLDENDRLIEVNEAYCAMSGYAKEELLKMSIADLEARAQGGKSQLERQREAQQSLYETRHRRKDGSEFPVEISVGVLSGARPRTVAIVRDISARERQRAAQQHAQRLEQLAVEAANELFTQAELTDENGIARRATELAASLTDSPLAYFCSNDAEQKNPQLVAVFESAKSGAITMDGGARALSPEGVVARTMHGGKALLSDDTTASEAHRSLPRQERSLLLPIVDGARTLALLCVANRDSAYTQAEQTLLGRVGEALTAILRNKRASAEVLLSTQRANLALQAVVDSLNRAPGGSAG